MVEYDDTAASILTTGEILKLHDHSADTRPNGAFSERSLYGAWTQTSLTIRLTSAQRQTLLAWQWSPTIPAGQARRGRMLLLLADGVPITHIAAVVGISRRYVYKWVQRFLEKGLEGLTSKPGWRRQREPYPPHLPEQHDKDTG